MRAMLRVVKDSSGMALPLAMVMIVLIGVMGAGLLVFVSRDLNAVVEVNQGQRAFEVADAGVQAAKRQLASNVVRTNYDDPDGAPVDDIQWSPARGGLTLNDLSSASDSVKVTIKYAAETPDFPEHFLVVSEGTYGDARRKIEAKFEGVVVGAGGGDELGHPLYFTPSDIRIESQVQLNGISMFSEGDILIQGVTTPISFVSEYESAQGTLAISGANDELCDWNSAVPLNNCFEDTMGNWNTVGRNVTRANGSTVDFEEPGFAAEGKICGFPNAATPKGECGASVSAADGVYGYDSTTGSKVMTRSGYSQPWGNNLVFIDKGNLEDNEPGTISYPFPRPAPIPEGFKELAEDNGDYFQGSPTPAQWNTLLDPSNPNRVAFVDAQNQTVNFDPPGNAQYKGILVVWCGDLTQNQSFQGIVLNLIGDGSDFGSTNCADDATKGVYTNNGQTCQCWMYSEGGTSTRAGMTLRNGSKIFFLPSGDWSFLNDLFESPPPTSFALDGWRELYQ